MREWIAATLLVFLAGGTTGYLVGNRFAPDPDPTWKDGYLQTLGETVPDITPADLDHARKILDRYEERVLSLKSKLDLLLRDQLEALAAESKGEIQEIIASYGPAADGD